MDDKKNGSHRLLVVSNRLPELRSAVTPEEKRGRNVGGLVSALEPVLAAHDGVWLGWSGRVVPDGSALEVGVEEGGRPVLAWVDLAETQHRHYYNGVCNSSLWPLFHSFPERARFSDDGFRAYREVNDFFANAAQSLIDINAPVWVHDYHLLMLGQRLKERGHRGPVGQFLHIPFPGPDILTIFPWAETLLRAMLDFDLVGFHTPLYAANFHHCARELLGAQSDGQHVVLGDRRVHVGAFPIGIFPESFQEEPTAEVVDEIEALMHALKPAVLVLGVDRLDYTKGIPERLLAFGRLLELYPQLRGKVSLVQISVPSRADVAEYAEQRARVETIVGRVNGDFGDPRWVPIRYYYRAFSRQQLAQLYRHADIGYVTPLRDGMNLVAKEYVAAQDIAHPGVLLLSRFAGAAAELCDAVLTNPWHVDGMAHDLAAALAMPQAERQTRHTKLLAVVKGSTARTWAQGFLDALMGLNR